MAAIPLLSAFYFGSVEHYRLLAAHPKVVIDTNRRTWAITLPDRRVCEGNLRAASQARVGQALVTLAARHTRMSHQCRLEVGESLCVK